MKTKILTYILVSLFVKGFSQPYGQTKYITGTPMTSGYRTSINFNNTGFLMAGTDGTFIRINKTYDGGVFAPVPQSFQKSYKMYENGGCVAPWNLVNTCVGVTAIEINQPNTAWYAYAGAYNEACFVTFLHPDGDVDHTKVYPFLYSSPNINKPIIVEEPFTQNLYVCGKFDIYMYVMKLNPAGVVIWSHYYDNLSPGGGIEMVPKDILISPFNGEIIIVGHQSPNTIQPGYPVMGASNCFFISLAPTNGAVISYLDYNAPPTTPDQYFNSVIASNNPIGGPGYVLGGRCDGAGAIDRSLLVKVDLMGNIIWQNIVTGTSQGVSLEEIRDVVERLNTSNNYEYYALVRTFNAFTSLYGMSVYKFDANGNPNPGINEYRYQAAPGDQFIPVSLSYHEGFPFNDEGLHVYANYVSGGVSDHYLLESYFNGVTGCPNESFTSVLPPLQLLSAVNCTIQLTGSLSDCNDLVTFHYWPTTPVVSICSNPFVVGGSNARGLNTTGLASHTLLKEIEISPNPCKDKLNIKSNAALNLNIVNELGQLIKKLTLIAESDNTFDISDISPGLYFVTGTSGNNVINEKLIITE